MRKYVTFIIDGILAVGVIVLFVLFFNSKCSPSANCISEKKDSSLSHLNFAFVNVDSLLLEYNWSKEMNDAMFKKQEEAKSKLESRIRKFENDYRELERKVRTNAFLTDAETRVRQEEERLMREQQKIQELDATLSQELLLEQQRINEQLRDSVMNAIEVFNAQEGNYNIILSNTMNDNILYGDKSLNITGKIIDILNSRYVKK